MGLYGYVYLPRIHFDMYFKHQEISTTGIFPNSRSKNAGGPSDATYFETVTARAYFLDFENFRNRY